jgi:IS5 family transposase
MKQLSLASSGFDKFGRATKRSVFLAEMDRVVPWPVLSALVEPVYPSNEVGRPTIGVERMLRIHFLQHWFNLSDPAVEEALYDSEAMRRFVGIDLGQERAPDETTICKFRHLLERNQLGKKVFATVNEHLKANGLRLSTGTIVDATIISAPSSTKNRDGKRDPEMHQTKKGNQWFFGMKAHIGVDSRSKLIHSVEATAANVHDARVLPSLLHGDETRVYGDQAYRGQKALISFHAPEAKDFTNQRYRYGDIVDEVERRKNRTKSKIRSRVEHVFAIFKLRFGFTKVRYRGLAKNANRLEVTAALANLYIARRYLLATQA